MDLALNGKIALVTGAASGVGREIALGLAAEGARVAGNYRPQIDPCLYGAIHCCHAAAPHLNNAKNGRIVGVVGDSSRVGESGLAIVAAARAGVIALMKSLAREFGRFGTTANTVSLGLVETQHDAEWVAANREKLIRLYPVRRLGLANDVAPMVTLLASPHAGWITGQVISISGGFSMV